MAYGLYSPMGDNIVARDAANNAMERAGITSQVLSDIGTALVNDDPARVRRIVAGWSPAQRVVFQSEGPKLAAASPGPTTVKIVSGTLAAIAAVESNQGTVVYGGSSGMSFQRKAIIAGVGIVGVGLLYYVAKKHWR